MKNLSLKARDIVGEWAAERNDYYYNSPTRFCDYDICGNYSQVCALMQRALNITIKILFFYFLDFGDPKQ